MLPREAAVASRPTEGNLWTISLKHPGDTTAARPALLRARHRDCSRVWGRYRDGGTWYEKLILLDACWVITRVLQYVEGRREVQFSRL